MKYLLLIILTLTFMSCSESKTTLSENDTFIKTFTKTEIQDLQLLFDFFNESICSDIESDNLSECYIKFFEKMKKFQYTGDLQIDIQFENQMDIYKNFSDSTFQEIWSFGKSWDKNNSKDTFRTVYFNWEGKYLQFLDRVGEEDKVIKHYSEAVKAAGDIPPSLVAGLLMNYEYYNIEDIRVKFIVAIHYLTLNDQFRRVEKMKNSG